MSQLTAFRDHRRASWSAARVYEAVAVVAAAGLAAFVIRGLRRARDLTLDAMICIGGALTFWMDPLTNVLAPIWMYSSNWVNVHPNWCGHMPLVVNPDCGQMPEPMFMFAVYAFGILGFAIIMNAVMRWARKRWPLISTARLLMVAFACGAIVGVAVKLRCIGCVYGPTPGFRITGPCSPARA